MAYYIPWYFGLKDRKKLAVFGIVLLLVISVPFGLNLSNIISSSTGDVTSSADGVLINGTASPLQSNSATTHQFSVIVTDPSITNVTFSVRDSWNSASQLINITSTNSTAVGAGRLFTQTITLTNNSLYEYYFSTWKSNATVWTYTTSNYVIDVPQSTLQVHMIEFALFYTFFVAGLLFFLLLLLAWFFDRSKKKAQGVSQQIELTKRSKKVQETDKETGKPDKFVCSECGAEVPADSKECPKCGEKFDDDSGDFICTECGAKVKENDKKCWNCGKEFEN